MYTDKLDGRIDNDFFDRHASQYRAKQDKVLRDIEKHKTANRTYIDDGIRIFELTKRASGLFEKQSPHEKRRLLNFLVSNSTWKDGKLTAIYRPPFDIIAKSAAMQKEKEAAFTTSSAISDIWLLE